MSSAIAEHLDKKIGTTIDHLWMISEFRNGIHHPEHFSDTHHIVQAASSLAHRRKQHKASEPCVLIGFFDRHVLANFSRELDPCRGTTGTGFLIGGSAVPIC